MNIEDKRLRKALDSKSWNEIKTKDSWQIFKIMSEFVEGFDTMAKIGPCVSIFGSARTTEESDYYQLQKRCFSTHTKRIWCNYWWRSWNNGKLLIKEKEGKESQ